MDSAKLKVACILAGIEVHEDGTGCFIDIHGAGVFFYFNDPHPMFIAHVASVLVAKIPQVSQIDIQVLSPANDVGWLAEIFVPVRGVAGVSHVSTMEEGPFVAIIRAAVAALESQEH